MEKAASTNTPTVAIVPADLADEVGLAFSETGGIGASVGATTGGTGASVGAETGGTGSLVGATTGETDGASVPADDGDIENVGSLVFPRNGAKVGTVSLPPVTAPPPADEDGIAVPLVPKDMVGSLVLAEIGQKTGIPTDAGAKVGAGAVMLGVDPGTGVTSLSLTFRAWTTPFTSGTKMCKPSELMASSPSTGIASG